MTTAVGAVRPSAHAHGKANGERVTLVIASLGAGGAERVMSVMANHWAGMGRETTLVTLYPRSADFYTLHPRVRRVGLNVAGESRDLWHAVRSNTRRVRTLRRAISDSRPDVVVSFLDSVNVLTLLATVGMPAPVIVSERIDPTMAPVGAAWETMRRLLYPRASAVVIQTERIRAWTRRFIPDPRVVVIPNPVQACAAPRVAERAGAAPGRRVVAVGRLEPQKGFDLLLHAFASCRPAHPDWSLVIAGEGGERARLEALAASLGIPDAVSFPGRTNDPTALFRASDLFVLSSRFEGFPNTLLEAMACGLAVVATDCRSGPREIVRDGVDGVLVPVNDVDALASAMDRLMASPEDRSRLGERALEVGSRFAVDAVMRQWDLLVARVAGAAVGRGAA